MNKSNDESSAPLQEEIVLEKLWNSYSKTIDIPNEWRLINSDIPSVRELPPNDTHLDYLSKNAFMALCKANFQSSASLENSTCVCGDVFNENFKGICPNCLAELQSSSVKDEDKKITDEEIMNASIKHSKDEWYAGDEQYPNVAQRAFTHGVWWLRDKLQSSSVKDEVKISDEEKLDFMHSILYDDSTELEPTETFVERHDDKLLFLYNKYIQPLRKKASSCGDLPKASL